MSKGNDLCQDGVVVTIPCAELVEGSAFTAAALLKYFRSRATKRVNLNYGLVVVRNVHVKDKMHLKFLPGLLQTEWP